LGKWIFSSNKCGERTDQCHFFHFGTTFPEKFQFSVTSLTTHMFPLQLSKQNPLICTVFFFDKFGGVGEAALAIQAGETCTPQLNINKSDSLKTQIVAVDCPKLIAALKLVSCEGKKYEI
jgi:hypothetical protein